MFILRCTFSSQLHSTYVISSSPTCIKHYILILHFIITLNRFLTRKYILCMHSMCKLLLSKICSMSANWHRVCHWSLVCYDFKPNFSKINHAHEWKSNITLILFKGLNRLCIRVHKMYVVLWMRFIFHLRYRTIFIQLMILIIDNNYI